MEEETLCLQKANKTGEVCLIRCQKEMLFNFRTYNGSIYTNSTKQQNNHATYWGQTQL